MAHKDWCGKPCGECLNQCRINQATPCSPDSEALNEDGSCNTEVCLDNDCDVVDSNDIYACCLHNTPRRFD